MMYARDRHTDSLVWIEPKAVDGLKEMPAGTLVTLRSGSEFYLAADIAEVQEGFSERRDFLDLWAEVERGVAEKFQQDAERAERAKEAGR